jgi:hypothetical protein
MRNTVPIILFAHARPEHLGRTLDCLRENRVPRIHAFSDGPRTPDKAPAVAEVRRILRAINWCEVVLCERETNLGLGRSILTGVTEVLSIHDAAIIFEEDLACVPNTYAYLCAALQHYRDNPRVMSVTGWTHPVVTPSNITDQPHFDGRGESLCWGTWARAWQGMREDARTLMHMCKEKGMDVYRYGADLVGMAKSELRQNIWAVRFAYWQMLNGGLVLRPPWSMVEHIGFDAQATNAKDGSKWANPPLKPCPPIPEPWPEPVENPECSRLWQKACGKRPTVPRRLYRFVRRMASTSVRRLLAMK